MVGTPTSRPTPGITPLLSQTTAGRRQGRTPWESQPKRQAIHEPTRPTTYRTLRPHSHTEPVPTYKSAIHLDIEAQLGVGSDADGDGGFCFAVVEDGEDLESGAEAVEVAA